MPNSDDDQLVARELLEDKVEDEVGRLKAMLSLDWRKIPASFGLLPTA